MLNIQQQWGVAFRGRAFLVIIEAVFQTFFDLLGIGLFTENNIAPGPPPNRPQAIKRTTPNVPGMRTP